MRLAALPKTLPPINYPQTVGSLERQHPPWILRGGKRADLIQVFAPPIVDFSVVEPVTALRYTSAALGWNMSSCPPVLERRHVLVQRLPVVGDDDDPALRSEPVGGT
jgi:hypothetical protein